MGLAPLAVSGERAVEGCDYNRMGIIIGLIVAACIWFNDFLEDQHTKNMDADQLWDHEWRKLERKGKFGRYKR